MTNDRLARPHDTTTPSHQSEAERDRRRRLEAEQAEREQKRTTAAERRKRREHEQARKQGRDQAAEQSRQALDQEIARLRALNEQRPIMPAAYRASDRANRLAEVEREAAVHALEQTREAIEQAPERLAVEPHGERVVRLASEIAPIARFAYAALLIWVAVMFAWSLVDAVASRLPHRGGLSDKARALIRAQDMDRGRAAAGLPTNGPANHYPLHDRYGAKP